MNVLLRHTHRKPLSHMSRQGSQRGTRRARGVHPMRTRDGAASRSGTLHIDASATTITVPSRRPYPCSSTSGRGRAMVVAGIPKNVRTRPPISSSAAALAETAQPMIGTAAAKERRRSLPSRTSYPHRAAPRPATGTPMPVHSVSTITRCSSESSRRAGKDPIQRVPRDHPDQTGASSCRPQQVGFQGGS